MKKSPLAAVMAAVFGLTATHASAAILADDDFNYPLGDLAGNDGWGYVGGTTGNSAIDPTVVNLNLSHPDRLANGGNSAALDGGGASANAKLTTMADQTPASGSVYYSLLLNVSNIAGITSTTTGSFFAGFSVNDTLSPGVTSISTSAGVLLIHQDADNANAYNLGVGVTETNPDRIFDTTELVQGTTYFVVVGYDFGVGSDDDIARLWIDPLPSTYGAAPPAAQATSFGATDATAADRLTLASFYLRNNSVEPAQTLIDDLLVGNTWAEVTAVPEPGAIGLAGIGMLGLLPRWRRRA